MTRRGLRRGAALLLVLTLLGAGLAAVHLSMPGWYARWWYPLDHNDLIVKYARQNRLDPSLVAAVIYKESGFKDDTTSRAGAVGLMQLMPDTASWIGGQMGPGRPDPGPAGANLRDPEVNISYGCWYLRYLLDRYGNRELALAAYNGGTRNVDGWLRSARAAGRDFESSLDIPYPETRDYIADVDRLAGIYERAYADELTESR